MACDMLGSTDRAKTAIPNDDGLPPSVIVREIFAQVGMHDEKRPQVPHLRNSAL
jgi:hypothetical protein